MLPTVSGSSSGIFVSCAEDCALDSADWEDDDALDDSLDDSLDSEADEDNEDSPDDSLDDEREGKAADDAIEEEEERGNAEEDVGGSAAEAESVGGFAKDPEPMSSAGVAAHAKLVQTKATTSKACQVIGEVMLNFEMKEEQVLFVLNL